MEDLNSTINIFNERRDVTSNETIKNFDYNQIKILKDEINFYIERDESLLNDPNIAAFLETLAALQKTAEGYKADAIVNIQSSYEGNTLSSSNNYLCDPGFFVAGVGLKADVVTFKK